MIKKPKEKMAEFIKWFGPLLDALRQLGGSGKPKEVVEKIAKNLKIPDIVLEETLKSGTLKFHNQVAWARQYLVWEGLLEENTRGIWTLSQEGFKKQLSEEQARQIVKNGWISIQKQGKLKLRIK